MEEATPGGKMDPNDAITVMEFIWPVLVGTMQMLNQAFARIWALEAVLVEKQMTTHEELKRHREDAWKQVEAAVAVNKVLDPQWRALYEVQERLKRRMEELLRRAEEQKSKEGEATETGHS
jgi:predicted nucleotide-binding protein (sugar kinase/HSP70/actin superfamily)